MSKTILSLILYFIVVGCIKCDYYSSISGLETLLRVENHYMWAIGKHLVEVERLQTELDRLIDELDTEYEKRQQSSEFYYDYPVNAFKAINRIAADWQEVFKLTRQIENLTIYNESSHIPEDAVTLPTDEDLRGAARGLSRLQQLYKLDITNITDGYLRDRKYSSEMSAFNCYVLGKSLYESEEYLTASEWLIEALEKSEKENEKSNNAKAFDDSNINGGDIENTTDGIFPYVSIAEILEFLAPALFYAGKHELALAVNSKLLSLEPDNSIGLSNRDLITAETKIKRRTSFIEAKYDKSEIQDLYEQTCSGEFEQRIAEKSQLHCHFTTKNVPYYLLGPLKMEELNTDPFVAVYHDVIYDKEIKEIIARSKSDIERSTIGSEDNSDINEVRISKNSWLAYDSALMAKISQRVADITGLSMNMSEDMQVANYGIGGYYGTHYDFSENPEEDNPDDGNRILTAMFYLNDVDLGGATAFPHLRLAVPPIKHSLVVWYNLHRSLEPDFRTAHAGCPVLKDSKWIGNIWFHAVGQELIRPCDLKPDHDISKPHMAMGVD